MNDQQTEALIKARGADVAPRLTPMQIDAVIVGEYYFTARDGVMGELAADGVEPTAFERASCPVSLSLLTFCVLVLRNGFTVTGESAVASPENFNADIGRQIARTNAAAKVWALEGYLLKQMLHVAAMDAADALQDSNRTDEGSDAIQRALASGDPEAIKLASSSRSAVVS